MHDVERDWMTEAGYRAVCLMVRGSHRCGYVGVPKGHPLYGVSYGEPTEVLRPAMQRTMEGQIGKRGIVPVFCASGEDDDNRLRGDFVFDVHGSLTFSGKGEKGSYPLSGDEWWFGFDCAHADDQTAFSPDGELRSREYVESECESLARQLKEVEADAMLAEREKETQP